MRLARLAPLGALGLALACGGSSTTAASDCGAPNDGAAQRRTPAVHRAAATASTAPRPAGVFNASPTAGSPCVKDADCTSGKEGRCEGAPIGGSVPPGTNLCTYDACAADADCGGASVCDCRNAAAYDANTCFHGNCRTDGDCGAGYCSPSLTTLGSTCLSQVDPGSIGFFCHVAADECTDDADCGGGGKVCTFSVPATHWICLAPRCPG